MSKFTLTFETSFDMRKPYTIKKINNPLIKQEDVDNGKFNTYHKCDVKSGVVNQIISKDQEKRVMNLQLVYYQLNTISLNLYNTMGNEAQLIATMPIEHVTRLLQIFTGTQCITFILKTQTGREKEGITVCPENEIDKDDFIQAFTDFKECDINVHHTEKNEEVILDFTKVNYLLQQANKTDSSEAIAAREKEILSGMFYDNSQKTIRRPLGDAIRTSAMKREIARMVATLKKSNLAEQRIKRRYQGKIAEAEKIGKDIEKQKAIVREILQKRAQKQKERKAIIKRKVTQKKELKLMKAVRMQIKKIKKQEIKQTKKAFKKQLNFVKGVPEKKKPTKSKNAMYKTMTELGEPIDAYDSVEFAGSLPATMKGPLARALINKYGPLGNNKLVKLARVPGMVKKYRALNKKAAIKNKIATKSAKKKLCKDGKVCKKKIGKVPEGRRKVIRGPKGKIIKLTHQTVQNPTKLFDYAICMDPRLTGFIDTEFINGLCSHLYGESQFEECRQRQQFCTMCCGFFVGAEREVESRQCHMKCETTIGGNIKPEEKVKNSKTDLKEPKKSEKTLRKGESGDPGKSNSTQKHKKSSTKKNKRLKAIASKKTNKPVKSTHHGKNRKTHKEKIHINDKMKSFFKGR